MLAADAGDTLLLAERLFHAPRFFRVVWELEGEKELTGSNVGL